MSAPAYDRMGVSYSDIRRAFGAEDCGGLYQQDTYIALVPQVVDYERRNDSVLIFKALVRLVHADRETKPRRRKDRAHA